MPRPNGPQIRPPATRSLRRACWASHFLRGRDRPCGVVIQRERCAEHGHHRVADELHHACRRRRGSRAFISARCALSWRASSLGSAPSRRSPSSRGCPTSGRSPRALGLSDRAGRSLRSFSATPPGSSRLRRLALLLAIDDRLVQQPQPPQARSVAATRRLSAKLQEELLDRVGDRLRRGLLGDRDRLDRASFGHDLRSSSSWSLVSSPSSRPAATSASTIAGSSIDAPGRHLADRPSELVALGDAVLQQVGVAGRAFLEQRHRVLGVVVLREHDDAGAGVPLAQISFAASMPSRWNVGRHPDIGDETCGAAAPAPATSSS